MDEQPPDPGPGREERGPLPAPTPARRACPGRWSPLHAATSPPGPAAWTASAAGQALVRHCRHRHNPLSRPCPGCRVKSGSRRSPRVWLSIRWHRRRSGGSPRGSCGRAGGHPRRPVRCSACSGRAGRWPASRVAPTGPRPGPRPLAATAACVTGRLGEPSRHGERDRAQSGLAAGSCSGVRRRADCVGEIRLSDSPRQLLEPDLTAWRFQRRARVLDIGRPLKHDSQ